MTWWGIGLVVGALAAIGLELRRRREARVNGPTLVQEWIALMRQPVLIKGELRQPKLKKCKATRPRPRAVPQRKRA
jgi:hypothetical protein